MKIRINAISLMLLLAASAAIAHAGVPGLRPAASGDDTRL
jgi:hypothetical protein